MVYVQVRTIATASRLRIMMQSAQDLNVSSIIIPDDGRFPGNADLPLVLYRAVLDGSGYGDFEDLFHAMGWSGTWRNGIFPYHHYHSTAHEAIGIARGTVRVQFGGWSGPEFTLGAGDAVVIPAGVAHKNLEHSEDYLVIGAYPGGEVWDIHTGIEGERPRSDENIRHVELPKTDPVAGRHGPLVSLWHLGAAAR
jgi:uncharacterized protein YjlB